MLIGAVLGFAAIAVATPTGSIEDYARAIESRSKHPETSTLNMRIAKADHVVV